MKKKDLILVIGDKNLSSWSMRPWLAIKASGLPFTEKKLQLDVPSFQKLAYKYSPTGNVPVLIDGKTSIWDSLAICEYLNELNPEAELLPRNREHRAVARSLMAEMHSGYSSLRAQLSMDINLRIKINHLLPETIADIKRISHIWSRSIAQSKGPYLFGKFNMVDAFYAPAVMRFRSYGIELKDPRSLAYMKSMIENPFVKEWVAGAAKEKAQTNRF